MTEEERKELDNLRHEIDSTQSTYDAMQDELMRLEDEYNRLTEGRDDDAEDSDEAVALFRRINKLEGQLMDRSFKEDRLEELEELEEYEDLLF